MERLRKEVKSKEDGQKELLQELVSNFSNETTINQDLPELNMEEEKKLVDKMKGWDDNLNRQKAKEN